MESEETFNAIDRLFQAGGCLSHTMYVWYTYLHLPKKST